jgi:hypothetical protein
VEYHQAIDNNEGPTVRKRLFFVVGVVALVAAAAAWRLFHLSDLARIGAGYAAQQTCACLFVSRRPAESCRMDLDPLARRLVWVELGPAEVTARAFGVARATARYQKGLGCSLQD